MPYLQFREDGSLVMAESLAALNDASEAGAFEMDGPTLQVTNTRCGDAVGAYTVRPLHDRAGRRRMILSMQSDRYPPRWGTLAQEFVEVE